MNNTKRLIINSKWIYLAKIFAQVINLLSTILILRKLDVSIFGVFSFLITTQTLLELIGLSPIIDVLNRYLPQFKSEKADKAQSTLIIMGLGLTALFLIIVIPIVISGAEQIFHFFNVSALKDNVTLFCLLLVFSSFKITTYQILVSFGMIKESSKIDMLSMSVKSVLLLIFLQNITLERLIYIEVFVALIVSVLSVTVFIRLIGFSFNDFSFAKLRSSPKSKRLIRFGVFSGFNEIGSGIVGKTSDYFIISAIANSHALGIYSFSYRLYSILYRLIPQKEFMTVLRPLMIDKFSRDKSDDNLIFYYHLISKVLVPVFSIPAVLFIAAGKEIIVVIFDPKYVESYVITVIILFSNIALGFFFPLWLIIQIKEKVEILFYSKIIAIFSIPLGIWAMQSYGLVGVAAATTVLGFLKNLIMLYWIKPTINLNFWNNIYQRLVVYLVLLISSAFLISYIPLTISFVSLGLKILLVIFSTYLLFVLIRPYGVLEEKNLQSIIVSMKHGNNYINFLYKLRLLREI